MTEKVDLSKVLLAAFVMLVGFLIAATVSFLVDIFGTMTLASLWLLAAGLGVSWLLLYGRKRKEEIYSDIAEGLAPHNWWPGQVSPSHPQYDEWDIKRKRLISYKNRVQKDMRDDYARLVHFLSLRKLSQPEADEAIQVLRRLQEKAKRKIGQ